MSQEPASTAQPNQTEVNGAAAEAAPAPQPVKFDADQSYPFNIVILIPKRTFPLLTSANRAAPATHPAGRYLSYEQLILPSSSHDTARDIRQSIADHPLGFWLGAFGLVPVRLTPSSLDAASAAPTPAGVAELLPGVRSDKLEIEEIKWRGTTVLPGTSGKEREEARKLDLSKKRILEEFTEMYQVFDVEEQIALGERVQELAIKGGEPLTAKEEAKLLCIFKVVEVPYTDADARLHFLRLRDLVVSGSAPVLQNNPTSGFPGYDPTSLAVDAAPSLYLRLRGPTELAESEQLAAAHIADQSPSAQTNGVDHDHEDGDDAVTGGKGKKGKGGKAKPAKPAPKQAATDPSAPAEAPFVNPFADFSLSGSYDPFAALLKPRTSSSPASRPPPSTLKSLSLSAWNPPPHPYRLRGHFLYLALTTLEGELLNVTACRKGFFVNKITNNVFDPSPASKDGQQVRTFQNLYALLVNHSNKFRTALATRLGQPPNEHAHLQAVVPDLFATVPVGNFIPPFPHLVPNPTVSQPIPSPPSSSTAADAASNGHALFIPDPVRSQTAFLLMNASTAESLPPARDWNEEFAATAELPRRNQQEQLLHDRVRARLQTEFANAAAKSAVSIIAGDVPPLNPSEKKESHMYMHGNILFTRGDADLEAGEAAVGRLGEGDQKAAAHVVLAKDVAGVGLIEKIRARLLEVENQRRTSKKDGEDESEAKKMNALGVHTMASVVIDYAGQRWLAQSLVPGLFKLPREAIDPLTKPADLRAGQLADEAAEGLKEGGGDAAVSDTAGFRILYGGTDPEEPRARIGADKALDLLIEPFAKELKLAKHKVEDKKGGKEEIWLSADSHGIRGTDGRAYIIDLYRLTPVDALFLKDDIDGGLYSAPGVKAVESAKEDFSYPHRMTFLRHEAVMAHFNHELRKWVTAEVVARNLEQEQKGTVDEKTVDDKEDQEEDKEQARRKSLEPFDINEFDLSYNPDAFVHPESLPSKPSVIIPTSDSAEAAAESDSTKSVREASVFLRDTIIPTLVSDLISNHSIPIDGRSLTAIMHEHGVNMRYLGRIAHLVGEGFADLEKAIQGRSRSPEWEKLDLDHTRKLLRRAVEREMVVRSAKGLLREHLANVSTCEYASAVSHFLNCLFGAAREPKPRPDTSDLDEENVELDEEEGKRKWTDLTAGKVKSHLETWVVRRFRYALEKDWIEKEAIIKPQLLREVCARTGVQLEAKEYVFGAVAKLQVNGHATTNGVNGHDHDDDDSAGEQQTGTSAALGKKKKGGKKGKKDGAGPGLKLSGTTFVPSDVINVVPLVKQPSFKSEAPENMVAKARLAFNGEAIDQGLEYLQEAHILYEQVYGNVHPEVASYHRASGFLHQRFAATPIFRQMEALEQEVSRLPDGEEKAEKEARLDMVRIEFAEFMSMAVRLLRQAVIVSERANGIDATDTIKAYMELATFEQTAGDTRQALRILRHIVDLLHSAYGPNHPDALNAIATASQLLVVDRGVGLDFKLHLTALETAVETNGPDSIVVAGQHYQLAELYFVANDLENGIVHAREFRRIYEARFGPDDEKTKTAQLIVARVEQSAQEAQQNEKERAARMARRLGMDESRTLDLLRKKEGSTAAGHAGSDDKTGSQGHLGVDELLSYITGRKAHAAGPSVPKVKGAAPRTKAKRARQP